MTYLGTNIEYAIDQLASSIRNSSQSTDKLTERLVFWTKVMAWAVAVQAVAIIIQIVLAFIK